MNRPSRGYPPVQAIRRSVGTSAFPSGFFRKERSSRTNGSCHSEVPPRYGYDGFSLCVDHICHVRDDAEHHCPHRRVHEDHVFFRVYVFHSYALPFLSIVVLVGLPFLLKSSWLWLYKCSDDDERHECCCYHDGDECAVHRPVVPVFVFFHNEKLLSPFAIHPPGGRKEKAREDLVFLKMKALISSDRSSKRSGTAFAVLPFRLPILVRSSNVRLSNG